MCNVFCNVIVSQRDVLQGIINSYLYRVAQELKQLYLTAHAI